MKPLLTSQQLIEHMKNKGISFELISETDAKDFLEKHNYYMKLAAYRENYQKYPNSSKRAGQYINLDFAYLQELSTIDRHLRYQILQMCLDIEHFLKVALLNAIENNPNEDGYCIVRNFIANTSNNRVLTTIRSHKSNYCRELIDKYDPDFPVWVFVELISFGDLVHLCSFYTDQYGATIGDRILLNSVRDIRNACAHSNCLINKLKPNGNRPHSSVVNRVKLVPGISESSRDKKLKNSCIYDYVCMLYAYNEIVSSSESRKKAYQQVKELFEGRMLRHSDWFSKNTLITSSYEFGKKVIDNLQSSVVE